MPTVNNAEAVVVDASAMSAVLFGEPSTDGVLRRVGRRRIVAPTLLRYEVVNTAIKKQRRQAVREDLVRRALELFESLDFEELPVPLLSLADVATDADLTAYDAAYLWLARTLGLELVTLDRGLAAAAGTTPADA